LSFCDSSFFLGTHTFSWIYFFLFISILLSTSCCIILFPSDGVKVLIKLHHPLFTWQFYLLCESELVSLGNQTAEHESWLGLSSIPAKILVAKSTAALSQINYSLCFSHLLPLSTRIKYRKGRVKPVGNLA
jgi:hypothetical protein